MTRTINLIAKITRRCNLRCAYCAEWRDDPTVMSPATIDRLMSAAFGAPGVDGVRFVWHGGEPTTCGIPYFEQLLAAQAKHRTGEQQVRNTVQTNGLLLNREWLRFFQANRFHVGLSFDGPPELHDTQRPTVGGSGSSVAVLRALRSLQEHGVPFGLLVVVTRRTIDFGPERMFDYLISLGVKTFAFLHERPPSHPLALYDPSTDYVGNDLFAGYIKRVFDLWFDRDDPAIQIREFRSIITACLGGNGTICTLAGDCIGRHFGVDVNGDVYHCDRYVTDDGYRFGNVHETDFGAILAGEHLAELRRRDRARVANYTSCPYLRICSGGCPHDHYIDSRSTVRSMDGCCGQRGLIEHILGRIRPDLQRANARHGLPVVT